MSNKDKPSFYAIIPAHVRYNKKLNSGAKLLYGEITALSDEMGFCWANNFYFSELYDVDIRTIQRWLEDLNDAGCISILLEKKGIKTLRKIFLSKELKEIFTTRQKCHGRDDKNVTLHHDKNVTHSITPNNTETCSVCVDQPPVAASPPEKVSVFTIQKKKAGGEIYTLERNDIFLAAVSKRKDWTTQEIDDVWHTLVDYENPINDPIAFCDGVIKNKRKMKGFKQCKPHKKTTNSKETLSNTNKSITAPAALVRPFQNWKLTKAKMPSSLNI